MQTEIKPSFLCNDMVTFCNSEDMEWFLIPQTIYLWNDSIYTLKIKHIYAILFRFQDVVCAIALIYKPRYQLLIAPPFILSWNNIVFFGWLNLFNSYELLSLVAWLISFKYEITLKVTILLINKIICHDSNLKLWCVFVNISIG